MAYELIYTSVPRGLKPSSRGFSTVAFTEGMPANYVQTCEGLSGYTHLFPPQDPNYAHNPVAYSHYRFHLGGQPFSILSRVAAYGTDYSDRSNKLAHHVMTSDAERVAAGPAWAMTPTDFFATEWKQEPHLIKTPRRLCDLSITSCRADNWREIAGDAGWAGAIAQRFLNTPDQPVFIIFQAGQNLLPLVAEITSLLPEDKRWNCTFNTYFTAIPQGTDCFLRCCLPNAGALRMSRRAPDALVLDLTGPRQSLTETGSLIEAARTGIMPAVQNITVTEYRPTTIAVEDVRRPTTSEGSKHKIRVSYHSGKPQAPTPNKRKPVILFAGAAAAIVLLVFGFIAVAVWPKIPKIKLGRDTQLAGTNATEIIRAKSPVVHEAAFPTNADMSEGSVFQAVTFIPSNQALSTTSTVKTGTAITNTIVKETVTNKADIHTLAVHHQMEPTPPRLTTPETTGNDAISCKYIIQLSETEKLSSSLISAFYGSETMCNCYNSTGKNILNNTKVQKPTSITGSAYYTVNTPSLQISIGKGKLDITTNDQSIALIHLQNKNTNLLIIVHCLLIEQLTDEKYRCNLAGKALGLLPAPHVAKITAEIGGRKYEFSDSRPQLSDNILTVSYQQNDKYKAAMQEASKFGDREGLKTHLSSLRMPETDIIRFIESHNDETCNKIFKSSIIEVTTLNLAKLTDVLTQRLNNDERVKDLRKQMSEPRTKGEAKKRCHQEIETLRAPLFDQLASCRSGDKTKLSSLLMLLDQPFQEKYKKDLREKLQHVFQGQLEKTIDAKALILDIHILSKGTDGSPISLFEWRKK